jgi:hypothetical protein
MAFPIHLIARGRCAPIRLANPAMMVAELAQTIYQYFPRLFQFQRVSLGMGALTLPTEIILMIASQLDTVSTISLALTCRRLYSLCFSTALSLDLTEKKRLLILLEQDEPKVYFCPRCEKLHYWHTRWNRSIPSRDIETKMRCKTYVEDTLYLSYINFTRYYHARMVSQQIRQAG